MPLIVTFGSTNSLGNQSVPLESGGSAHTEELAIGGTSVVTSIRAEGGRNVVTLDADADCWVVIGSAPVASAEASNRRFVKSGVTRQFAVGVRDKVAVIQV